MLAALAAGDEDDIMLRGIDVVVVEDEELVDAVFLEGAGLDDGAYGPEQTAVEDDILFAANLRSRGGTWLFQWFRTGWGGTGGGMETYAFEQVEDVLASLLADLVDVEFGARSHGGSQRIGAGERA